MEKSFYPNNPNNHNRSPSSPIKLYNVTLCKMHFGSMSKKVKIVSNGTNLKSL